MHSGAAAAANADLLSPPYDLSPAHEIDFRQGFFPGLAFPVWEEAVADVDATAHSQSITIGRGHGNPAAGRAGFVEGPAPAGGGYSRATADYADAILCEP